MKIIRMFLLGLILVEACKEPYFSPVSKADATILVVEGVFNPAGTTTILLSRTQQLNEKVAPKPELKAKVSIESDASVSYPLVEEGSGRYTLGKLSFSTTARYRLRIKTQAGKEYLSEFVVVKPSPPIGKIGWKDENGGLRIVVSTLDPANNTHYYRWETEETWEFHASLFSKLRVVEIPSPFGPRYGLQQLSSGGVYPYSSTCWRTEKSSSIWLATSTQLSQDLINESPIAYIENNSYKLSIKYSILVRQYALTKQAFDYWQNMKKNSEALGSLFSPQPSETLGNIVAVGNLQEPVIGFFEACAVTEKRIFINPSDVPRWNYNPGCVDELVAATPENIMNFYFGDKLPLDYYNTAKDTVTAVPNYCVNCAVRGSTVKPSFWP